MSSGELDTLTAAEARTRAEYDADPSVANLRKWNAAKSALDKCQGEAREGAGAERFKNITKAAAWVMAQGYLVTERTVRNHVTAPGFPKKQNDGSYLKAEIAAYAKATWENPSRPAEGARDTDYTDQVKKETARKLKLDNDIKEGKYLVKSEEESRDALLLYGIKKSVENWGPFVVQDLLALAGAELSEAEAAKLARITPELLARYRHQHAELFDKFARDGYLEVPDAN